MPLLREREDLYTQNKIQITVWWSSLAALGQKLSCHKMALRSLKVSQLSSNVKNKHKKVVGFTRFFSLITRTHVLALIKSSQYYELTNLVKMLTSSLTYAVHPWFVHRNRNRNRKYLQPVFMQNKPKSVTLKMMLSMESRLISLFTVTVKFSHEADDPTNPVVYLHFEEDQGWTNHGAQFVMEETPFADVRSYQHFVSQLKNTSIIKIKF